MAPCGVCSFASAGITGGVSPGRTPGPVVFGPAGEGEVAAPVDTDARDVGGDKGGSDGGSDGEGLALPPVQPHNKISATADPPTQRSMGES